MSEVVGRALIARVVWQWVKHDQIQEAEVGLSSRQMADFRIIVLTVK